MVKTEIKIIGLKKTQEKLIQVEKDLNGPGMIGAMSKAVTLVENQAKRLAPVDRGPLRASITSEVGKSILGNEIVGIVGSNKKYAPYQELGTRPFWPPFGPISEWVRRKFHVSGSDLYMITRGVQRSIARRGIKAKRYLQRAIEQNESKIIKILEGGVNDIVEK